MTELHLATSKPGILCTAPQFILDRMRDFPGTAALVETLLPYLNYVQSAVTAQTLVDKVTKQSTDYSRLPAPLAKEIRENLTALQSSAMLFEAQADTRRAGEIREEASVLLSIFKTLQQDLGSPALVASGKQKS